MLKHLRTSRESDPVARALHERSPVSLILAISMVAAGVYPVTDSALNHTSPIMIATLRAIAGGVLFAIPCR